MCRTFIFTCEMTIVPNVLIIFIIRKLFQECFSTNLTFSYDFSSSFVNGNIFLFSKSITFLACSLKDSQNVSYNLLHHIKYGCFPYYQKPIQLTLNIHKKHAHLFFAVEEFSRLFAHPSISQFGKMVGSEFESSCSHLKIQYQCK